jgi:hypothetical protein
MHVVSLSFLVLSPISSPLMISFRRSTSRSGSSLLYFSFPYRNMLTNVTLKATCSHDWCTERVDLKTMSNKFLSKNLSFFRS